MSVTEVSMVCIICGKLRRCRQIIILIILILIAIA
jgi:hypothetical protein